MTDRIGSYALAEAVFGSAARGDSDRLSDRDYLIVDDDVAILNRRANELKAEGWSVASYTFAKLEALSKVGALFIQHLKCESEVIEDSSGRLRHLLRSFQPKKSYLAEIEENSRLSKLIERRPFGPRGALWAADVLYVSLRNFGVLSLAEKGIFKFSFREVIEGLYEIGKLHECTPSDFLSLRFCKTLYRADSFGGVERVDQRLSNCLQALPRLAFPNSSVAVSAASVLIEASTISCPNTYVRIRAIEKGMIAAEMIDTQLFTPEMRTMIQQWIRNPRAYAFAANSFDLREFGAMVTFLQTTDVSHRHLGAGS